jgi:hypothetical protein
MATIPKPIGVREMLVDIASGIGGAARTLPEASRSEVGAVAMRGAKVEVEFELSSAARTDSATNSFGLGVRTFRFGGAQSQTETQSRNTGRITLDIVAIMEPAPRPEPDETKTKDRDPLAEARPDRGDPPTDPDPDPTPDRAKLRAAIEALGKQIDAADIGDDRKKAYRVALDRALAALAFGDVAAAQKAAQAVAAEFLAGGRR